MMWRETLLYFLTAAILENLVLTTGFGTSLLMRTSQRRRNLIVFALEMTFFAVCTVLIAYPIDLYFGTTWDFKLLRPAILVAITAVLYLAVTVAARLLLPRFYSRYGRLLPLAAFNNLVIAVALIINHRVSVQLLPALGLTLGACLGFFLLSLLTRECFDRTDHSDLPHAFRGLPITMLYLGILALACMGFASPFSF